MLKSAFKHLVRHASDGVRRLPRVKRALKAAAAASPAFDRWLRRVLVASFNEGAPPVTPLNQLTDAQLRVLLDLRELRQARQSAHEDPH